MRTVGAIRLLMPRVCSQYTPMAELRVQIFVEDAGFDWKILGPDVGDTDYVAWQCDQDAYACSGQKCSAQSILFMHKNWADAGGWSVAVAGNRAPRAPCARYYVTCLSIVSVSSRCFMQVWSACWPSAPKRACWRT